MSVAASAPLVSQSTQLVVEGITRHAPVPLSDVSFTLLRGQSAVLYSKDGSANAVLRAVIGIDPVDAGSSRLGSVELTRRNGETPVSRAEHIGLLLRDPIVARGRTLIDHIAQGMSSPQGLSHSQTLMQVSDSLGFRGADSAIVARLPKPLQYRVAIGRAIVGEPELIAADDPYVELEPRERHLLVALLQAVASEHEIGVLHATGDESVALRSQFVIVIEGGSIVRELRGTREIQQYFG